MRFITYETENCLNLGIIGKNDSVINLNKFGFKDMLDLIANFAKFRAEFENLATQISDLKLNQISLKAPIITPNSDIICLGINYMAHAEESYRFKKREFDGKREHAVYFSKRASRITGPNEGINGHFDVTNSLDYEVELAIIIGKDAKNVAYDDAGEYIFGYSVFNDISARDLQNRHKQWYFGKSLDGFAVMGPWIETEFDSKNAAIKSVINGEIRQNSNTSDMIFDEKFVISELSAAMTLKSGTIIALGTPSGAGMGFTPPKFLKSGDRVVCEIENLGKLDNKIL